MFTRSAFVIISKDSSYFYKRPVRGNCKYEKDALVCQLECIKFLARHDVSCLFCTVILDNSFIKYHLALHPEL